MLALRIIATTFIGLVTVLNNGYNTAENRLKFIVLWRALIYGLFKKGKIRCWH